MTSPLDNLLKVSKGGLKQEAPSQSEFDGFGKLQPFRTGQTAIAVSQKFVADINQRFPFFKRSGDLHTAARL